MSGSDQLFYFKPKWLNTGSSIFKIYNPGIKPSNIILALPSMKRRLVAVTVLFAISHDAARRAAAIYSFFDMLKKEDTNPFESLRCIFENIADTKVNQLDTLCPRNLQQAAKM